MLLRIHNQNPQERKIRQVVDCLRNDGVIIYPTDTVYGLGCDINSRKAFERVCQIEGIKIENARFSFLCSGFKEIGEYANQISTPVYKVMKRALPGPYTFILKGSKKAPRHILGKRKTVGIRIVDHPIPASILEFLGRPLLSTSLNADDEILEFHSDPELILENHARQVDIVIDAGFGGLIPSTVIDCSKSETGIEVLREGKGGLEILS